jgi:hypothetical protein
MGSPPIRAPRHSIGQVGVCASPGTPNTDPKALSAPWNSSPPIPQLVEFVADSSPAPPGLCELHRLSKQELVLDATASRKPPKPRVRLAEDRLTVQPRSAWIRMRASRDPLGTVRLGAWAMGRRVRMIRKPLIMAVLAFFAVSSFTADASALSTERWTDATPYGIFFNDYDPNFSAGFVPRVQDRERIKIHLARGNQLRVRMVLPDETVDNYLLDQVAKHDLHQEVIEKEIITLTANDVWERYHEGFEAEGLRALAARKATLSPEAWRALNIETIDKLNPERLYHIEKDLDQLVADWAALLTANGPAEDLESKLDLVNEFFPRRIFVYDLTEEQETAFAELVSLARAGDMAAFRPKAEAFFQDVTEGIYDVRGGKIDYYEYTAIFPAGTYDDTTKHGGRTIPRITTPGVWYFKPRLHGTGMTGMVDYISAAGYYGLIPMFPYEYAGGSSYNAIHNTGISNWIAGHRLLPKEWTSYTEGSRNGKPYNRVALTSRGPVSHGCTRLNSGHLGELREMLPSTSKQMEGIVN